MPQEIDAFQFQEALLNGRKSFNRFDPLLGVYSLDGFVETLKEVTPVSYVKVANKQECPVSFTLEEIQGVPFLFQVAPCASQSLSKLVSYARERTSNVYQTIYLDSALLKSLGKAGLFQYYESFLLAAAQATLYRSKSVIHSFTSTVRTFATDVTSASTMLFSSWLSEEILLTNKNSSTILVEERYADLGDSRGVRDMVLFDTPSDIHSGGLEMLFNPINFSLGIPITSPVILQLYWTNTNLQFKKREMQALFSGFGYIMLQLTGSLIFKFEFDSVRYRMISAPVL